MTPDQARDVVDASRSLTLETGIDSGVGDACSGVTREPEAGEAFASLDFLTFVENVTERTWRSADPDFGGCVELRGR